MMRWKPGLAGLTLLLAALTGCKQPLRDPDCDRDHVVTGNLPANFENDARASITPSDLSVPPPATTEDPDRPPRYLSLAEAIAISLEQGNIGSQSPLFPGIGNDTLVSFAGTSVVGSDAIRVLALDPAIIGANIEAALSKFDVRWISSMTWQKQDNAVSNVLGSFQNGDLATFNSGLFKPLPTGGVAGITFTTSYTKLSNPPANQQNFVNPSYRPALQASFEQPLLQGYGVEINQLTPGHPGSVVVQGLTPSGGTRTEGILITRLRFDEQRAEFERNVNFQLLNVEIAYWNLYGAYFNLYAREQALRAAFATYTINKARFEAGRIAIQDLAQTRAQFEQFRSQRVTALGTVLENERQLRALMGIASSDGCRLVPIDAPTLAPYQPDFCEALKETLAHRPELLMARQDLKARQLDILVQKNQTRPDLRFFATYDINGLGTRLDGPAAADPTNPNANALASFTDNTFNNWQIGLRLNMPIGFRDAHAALRQSRLTLARAFGVLVDQERKAERFLTFEYRHLFEYYVQIQLLRNQREANAQQLEARFQEFRVGRGTLDVLLEAQRNFADSLASEYQAIVNYNNALCGFQFAKGTIMAYDNVVISEGPLPCCAQVKAVDHLRERTKALMIREWPGPDRTNAEVVHPASLNAPPPAMPPGATKDVISGLPPLSEVPTNHPLPPPSAGPLTPAPVQVQTPGVLPGGVMPVPGPSLPGSLPAQIAPTPMAGGAAVPSMAPVTVTPTAAGPMPPRTIPTAVYPPGAASTYGQNTTTGGPALGTPDR
jgi:outer membrane protein TolC